MKQIRTAVLTVLGMLITSMAFAAHPLQTDDAGTTGKLKFQVETSGDFGWDRESEHGTTTKTSYQTLNTAITAGVLDSLDLVLTLPYTWQRIEDNDGIMLDTSGVNDLSLELKYRFLELGPASFAIKPAMTFPAGNRDRGLGAGRCSVGATLISTLEFNPVAIHANVGYTNQRYTDADRDGAREHLWNVSLAGAVQVMKGLQVVAEVGTGTNPDKGVGTWPAFIAGGVIYGAFEWLDLSVGVRGGLNAPGTDVALLAGLTFKFP